MPRAKEHVLDSTPARKPKKDLTGRTFNRWTVVEFAGSEHCGGNGGWRRFWKCKCSCGVQMTVQEGNLVKGKTKSCGCLKVELRAQRITHGMSRKGAQRTEYKIWGNILQRCTNPKNPKWMDYGGRGITVSENWLTFENFYADMGDRPTRLHTCGRRDNNGGYCKENCSWELSPEQVRNKRNNVLVTYGGETLCRHEMAAKYGIKYFTLRSRLNGGMTPQEAIETPIFQGKKVMKKRRSYERTVRGLRRWRGSFHPADNRSD